MRSSLSFFGPLRWLLPFLCSFVCVSGALAQTTTFSGTVYSPNGVPNGVGDANTGGDPIPNILVFAVDPAHQPPTFTQGIVTPSSSQTGCEAQPSLVPGIVLGSALTDYKGNFSFTTSGTLPNPLTIVIQAGKWRRQYQFDSTQVTAGTTNVLPPLVMPGSQAEGDLPHIAVVTGGVDGLECIFHQIGISDSEVTGSDGTGSINLFAGAYKSGEVNATGTTGSESSLVSNWSTLSKYDVVMFGCQGSANQPVAATSANRTNLINFADDGGRVFATHFEYVYLQQSPFSSAATFTGGSAASGLKVANIVQGSDFPEGTLLANWIDYVDADYDNIKGEIELNETAANVVSINTSIAQPWATLQSTSGVMQFTFDTPIGAAGAPVVNVSYTNNTTTFLQGDTADSVTVNIVNNSTADANNTLTLTVSLPSGLVATSIAGANPGTGWACNVSTLVCTRTASGQALTAGQSDPVAMTFSIPSNQTLGQASLSAILSGGGLSGTNQCGRVLFNDYHVENTSVTGSPLYPSQCSKLTNTTPAQEKFLEFSLYNLSNFVAPSTSDLIDIQGPVTLTWPATASVYYGTPLSATQLNANVADSADNTSVQGTLAYTSTPGGPITLGTILDAGTYELGATFTPDSATDYTTPAPIADHSFTVNPDPTTTSLTLNPATTPAGENVKLTAVVGDSYYSGVTGVVTFYDGTAVLGTGNLDASQTATYTINTFSLGSHQIEACLNASNDFNASCSSAFTEVITPPTTVNATTTLIASDLNPSVSGQSVTFTAIVASTGAFVTYPTGTVNFLDGASVIGTATLNNGVATFSTSTLAVGTHSITAVYAGSTAMTTSTSSVLAQQVNTSLASAGTGFLMTVSPTSFSAGVGSTYNLAVTVLELNGFNQPVSLSCSGLPAEATCSFGMTTMPATGGVTTLGVTVAAPHNCGTNTPYFTASGPQRGITIFAGLVLLFFARRRRVLKGILLAALLCILPAISGCGNCTDLGVEPGTYTFTVTGTATTPNPIPVVVPGDTVNGTTVTQTQKMTMTATL